MSVNITERELAEILRQNPNLRLNQKFSQVTKMGPADQKKDTLGVRAEILVPTEDEEQIRIAEKLDEMGLRWCHVPNGGYRDFKTAKLLRRMGVKPGVPDVLIFTPPPAFPGKSGSAIEMKRQIGGKVSPYQKEWLAALGELNWYTAVAEGYNEAEKVLRECGYTD